MPTFWDLCAHHDSRIMGKSAGALLLLLLTLFSPTNGGDTITPSQPLQDSQTLVSAGGSYALGFFRPGSSTNRYLGIWFAVSPEVVVWVANRDKPLDNSTGVFSIDAGGTLQLTDSSDGVVIWSSLLPNRGSNTSAQLLDSGNLVVKDTSSGAVLWESFDEPCDTLLAGMKLGRAALNMSLTSWRSPDDPARGDSTLELDPRGLPQSFLWNKRDLKYRAGPWNGLRFSGTPDMKSFDMFNFTVVWTHDGAYYQFGIAKAGILARLTLNTSGSLQRTVWDPQSAKWNLFWSFPRDLCDNYASCGPYGLCDYNKSPPCDCLPGFRPRNPAEWYMRDGTAGCVRETNLSCGAGDGFKFVQQLKLPDTVNATVNVSMSLGECREACLRNCSCTAYANANVSGEGSECVMWVGNLVDIRSMAADGQGLYVKVVISDTDSTANNFPMKKKVAILVAVLTSLLLLACCGWCIWRKRGWKFMKIEQGHRKPYIIKSLSEEDPELPLFDFGTIASATNNFSTANRIGKGGFGIVYKGELDDGQEVAVKRLSSHSGQGVDQFKTEVLLIAKLQHRNLVRLLGCCIDGEERMLIYEYMPNKSLDAFIFGDKEARGLLDWQKRLDIILGIVRGLLYLHQDSRLRIIHRDLKAGNILLDGSMNLRISDFGTARIMGRDQTEENTVRIVGTIGYMSSEYAMDGNFSEKSDVFSFGVPVLEILSGKKNRWISQTDPDLNLLALAWGLWVEGRCLDFLDNSLPSPSPVSELLKCIQVGLFCVQESPEERPSMQKVVLMLVNENPKLPRPKKPGFIRPKKSSTADLSSSGPESCSINDITVTNLEPR